MDNLNVGKLHVGLENSGLEIHGVSSNGEISWKKNPTKEQEQIALEVIKAHDPTPTPVETERERIKRIVKEEFNVTEKEK